MHVPFVDDLRRLALTPIARNFDVERFPEERYDAPPGDPGLFGPDSVTWRVHADPSLIVGGLSALMLQSLHPLAMAGVADHSDYRERPLARLSRTSSFVAATTYGSTQVAESVIAIVRAVHTRVTGTAPDGRPYSAADPELLRWVHVAEMGSFLRAHRRYHPAPVRGADIDRYFAETAVVAERLGATDVPRSRAEVRAYLRSVRPQLVAGDQAREAMGFLLRPIGSDPVTRAAGQLFVLAAVGLLPEWARRLHAVGHPRPVGLPVRSAVWGLLNTLRMVGGPPPFVAEARRRVAARPAAAAA